MSEEIKNSCEHCKKDLLLEGNELHFHLPNFNNLQIKINDLNGFCRACARRVSTKRFEKYSPDIIKITGHNKFEIDWEEFWKEFWIEANTEEEIKQRKEKCRQLTKMLIDIGVLSFTADKYFLFIAFNYPYLTPNLDKNLLYFTLEKHADDYAKAVLHKPKNTKYEILETKSRKSGKK